MLRRQRDINAGAEQSMLPCLSRCLQQQPVQVQIADRNRKRIRVLIVPGSKTFPGSRCARNRDRSQRGSTLNTATFVGGAK